MIEDLLDALTLAPDTQIDHTIIPRLKAVKAASTEARPDLMKAILDDCAHAALASDFAMVALDHVWQATKHEAGIQ